MGFHPFLARAVCPSGEPPGGRIIPSGADKAKVTLEVGQGALDERGALCHGRAGHRPDPGESVMPADEPATNPFPAGLTVVLPMARSAAETAVALERVRAVLKPGAADHEILVMGKDAFPGRADKTEPEQASESRVHWLADEGYGSILRSAARAARFPVIVILDPAVDPDCLDYFIPLAERYPVVWGNRVESDGVLGNRVASWSYNAAGRLLLGTRVRDCGNGLLMIRRSALADLLPTSDGELARAELLARARQVGLAVAEVPIRLAGGVRAGSWPSLRHLPAALGRMLALWWSQVLFGGRSVRSPVRASWLPGLLLVGLAALLLFPELNEPLQDPDEGRQAEIPREMLAHGDWLTPRMLGQPYYEKPPLQYWLTGGAYPVFGVRPWVARLVPALAAWLTVWMVYAWGRRFLGARAAFLGGLGLCLSMGFIIVGRTVVLDSLLSCCVMASWLAAHWAVRGPSLRRTWWRASAVACGLGVLAKGPVAVVLLVGPVAGYTWLTRDAARLRWRDWAAYLGVAVAVAGPWYAFMAATDAEYVNRFLWRANVVRFVEPFDHQHAWWFYLPFLFVAMLPWSLLWAWLAYFLCSRKRRVAVFRTPALGFCSLAAAWSLLFFSLAGCKSPLYIAPAVPPLALLHGVCLEAILFRGVGRRDEFMAYARQLLPRRATYVVLGLSAGCYIATGVLGWEREAIVALETAVTGAALAVWWVVGKRASPRVAWGACAIATLAMVVVAARDLVTGVAGRHSVAAIASIARRWPGSSSCPVVSYGRQWPSASFYLRRDLVVFFERARWRDLVEFVKQYPEVLILVENGGPMEELLSVLPPSLEAHVKLPQRTGQAALVVVQRSGSQRQARQD
jgi:4-amino-4-deoxy-L-arabinose transferase-like glycosyltransferase